MSPERVATGEGLERRYRVGGESAIAGESLAGLFVLDTLVTGPLERADSTLAAIRLAGGSASMRGLVEFSNAKSTSITTVQSRMRRALGLDYRVMDGLWLGLRAGKQRAMQTSKY